MKAATLVVTTVVGLVAMANSPSALAQRGGVGAGAGTIQCGEYLEDRKQNRYGDFYYSWVLGYLSAYNFFASHPQVEIPAPATIHAFLEKHCRDHPLDRLFQGVNSLLAELGGWRAPYLKQ